jgi:hypothetical protein
MTAPQTDPVLPIPPGKALAIWGMISLSIPNSWLTASSTASDQP